MSKTTLKYSGKVLRLYSQRKRLPNGTTVDLELIHHPGAVLIVPFLTDDKIVFIRQFRAVIDSYIWELPAGNLDQNESTKDCAYRELAEETGYIADSLKMVGYIYLAPGYSTEKIFIYTARKLTKKKAHREKDEVITTTIMSKRKVRGLLDSGKINDSKTISALTLSHVI